MSFVRDLHKGNKAEKFVGDILCEIGYEYTFCKNNLWDIQVFKPKNFTLEVKYDIMSTFTGNIAIEYFNPKKNELSGLSVTKADIWCIILNKPKTCWVCNVDILKDFILNNKPFRVIGKGGDDNSSMYLYKKENIMRIFKNLSEHKDKRKLIDECLCYSSVGISR